MGGHKDTDRRETRAQSPESQLRCLERRKLRCLSLQNGLQRVRQCTSHLLPQVDECFATGFRYKHDYFANTYIEMIQWGLVKRNTLVFEWFLIRRL